MSVLTLLKETTTQLFNSSPVRTRSSPNKTLRFNNVENLEPSCSRNLVTGVPNGPTHPNKKTKGAHKANPQPRNVQTSPKHYSAHQAKWTPTMHSPSPRPSQLHYQLSTINAKISKCSKIFFKKTSKCIPTSMKYRR